MNTTKRIAALLLVLAFMLGLSACCNCEQEIAIDEIFYLGYEFGYEDGLADSYDTGYDQGYEDGYSDGCFDSN